MGEISGGRIVRWRTVWMFFAVCVTLWGTVCVGEAAQGGQGPVRVFVSILPQKYFVERVGGGAAAVSVLVGKGMNHETYEPTPRQMADLSEASLYFRIGLPFEEAWLKRIVQTNPKLRVVDLRDGIVLRQMSPSEHDDHIGHDRLGMDPHVWGNPLNAVVMASRIRDVLSETHPAARDLYHRNTETFVVELKELDGFIRNRLKGVSKKVFAVFHPSWGYFADAYGLEQLAIEHEGREPGPRALGELIDRTRQAGIRTIFVEPQVSGRNAEAVASALGARVIRIDPLAEDYLSNMKSVAGAIAEALQ